MDEFEKIDEKKFWKDFHEKYSDKNFTLEVETPFEKHVFYSATTITQEELEKLILDIIPTFEINNKNFDKTDMGIIINKEKKNIHKNNKRYDQHRRI